MNQKWKYYKNGINTGEFSFKDNKFFVCEDGKYIDIDDYDKGKMRKYFIKLDKAQTILSSDIDCLDNNELHYEIDDEANKLYCQSNDDVILYTQQGSSPVLLDFFTYKGDVICFVLNNGGGSQYLIKDGYEQYTPLKEWFDISEKIPYTGSYKLDTFMVTMRDGAKLATNVYLPNNYKEGDRLYTILMRTPYGKERFEYNWQYYADRGFALVIQDVRGRYDSEGVFLSQYYEIKDGYDTVEWIVKQNWSNKKVGTSGGSYGGYVQWAIVASASPYVKAVFSQVTSGSPFVDIDRRGGGWNMDIIPWDIMLSKKEEMVLEYDDIEWVQKLKHRPLKDVIRNITGEDHPFWDDFVRHPDNDEFWEEMNLSRSSKVSDVAALLISGWHDSDMCGTMEMWTHIKKMQKDPSKSKLIMGPWEHEYNQRRQSGSQKLGANAIAYNMDILYLKWFEKHVKDAGDILPEMKQKYYIEGLNKWAESESFPPEYIQNKLFNILRTDDKGILTPDAGNVLGQEYSSYKYDPQNPTPQLKDPVTSKCFTPMDYSEVEKRDDITWFTSAPFDEDMVIAGEISVELYASSDAKDTDWVVRLTKVSPDGVSTRISDGYIRARYRNSFASPKLLAPNKVEKYIINMNYCAQLIKKGESIRLQAASAADGEMFPNHNTGNPVEEDTEYKTANQKIYHSKEHQTKLFIPIIKMGDMKKWITEYLI